MEEYINRITRDLNAWNASEQRQMGNFAEEVKGRQQQLRKLNFMEDLFQKYSNSASMEEKITLQLLKDRIDKQQRTLFLDRAFDLFLHKVARLLKAGFIASPVNRKTSVNYKKVEEQMATQGLSRFYDQAKKELDLGKDNFTLDVKRYASLTERLDYKITFAADESGKTQLQNYTVTLISTDAQKSGRSIKIDQGDKHQRLDQQQIYNLLNGRSVEQLREDVIGNLKPQWISLDFNDADSAGNAKLKACTRTFDLTEHLKNLMSNGVINFTETMDFYERLKKGDLIKLEPDEQRGLKAPAYLVAQPDKNSVGHFLPSQKKQQDKKEALKKKPNAQQQRARIGHKAKKGVRRKVA